MAQRSDVQSAFAELRQRYPHIDVVLTLGGDGLWYAMADQPSAFYLESHKVDAVDETAAGDAFIGAMLHRLATFNSLDSMDFNELTDAVTFAQKVSAYVCEKVGAMTALPTETEVQSRELQVLG